MKQMVKDTGIRTYRELKNYKNRKNRERRQSSFDKSKAIN